MVLTLWYIRSNSDDFNLTQVYGASPNFFSLKINHGGVFTKSPGRCYINGKVSFVDMIDGDTFSVLELNAMMRELGYVKQVPMWYHFRTPDSNLDFGLRALGNDNDVRYLLNEASNVVIEEIEDDVVPPPKQKVQKKVSNKLPCKSGLFIEQGNENVSKDSNNVPDNLFDDEFFSELVENDFGQGIRRNVIEKEVLQIVHDFGQGSGTNVTEKEVVQTVHSFGEGSRTNVTEKEVVQTVYDFGEGSGTNVTEKEVVQIENEIKNEFEGGSDSGEDSDFIVDDVVDIDDVEVDMKNFRNNNDDDVEWIGCRENPTKVSEGPMEVETLNLDDFDSGTDSESDPVRKEALKRLRRERNTNPYKKAHFYVGQTSGTKAEIKELVTLHSVETRRHLHITKNDKKRIRVICRGSILIFSESSQPNLDGPAIADGPTDPNVGGPIQPTSMDVSSTFDGPSQCIDGPNQSLGPNVSTNNLAMKIPVNRRVENRLG